MGDDLMATRFPAGDAMLRSALRRQGIRRDQVTVELVYNSWSWALRVTCPEAGYRKVEQLAPDALRADTAFSELCQSISEELGQKLRRARALG